jgi:hypothetical protein
LLGAPQHEFRGFETLRRLGRTAVDHAQGEARKVELGRLLREETTMTLARIAQRLRMGSWGYISNLLNGKVKSANI